MVPCEGIFVDFWKADFDQSVDNYMTNSTIELYKMYKQFYEGTKGRYIKELVWININPCIVLDPEVELDLKFVRIYFNTATFDRVKKDRAAKFVNMLSAVGGTMGLLTGFSIISGVEIIYFLAKIFIDLVMSKKSSSHIEWKYIFIDPIGSLDFTLLTMCV